jgi:hypothetical protein
VKIPPISDNKRWREIKDNVPFGKESEVNIEFASHTNTKPTTIKLCTRSTLIVTDSVRKMIFSIKVFITLLDYLKIPQVTILGDLYV